MFHKIPRVSSELRADYQIKYSQNFIKSQHFANHLINFIPTNLQLPVVEIASGTGMLSRPLLNKTNYLTLIEKDKNIFDVLKNNFPSNASSKNIDLVNADLFDFSFPKSGDYIVAGNIPFAFTADIIRFLLNLENPPKQTYLLMQLEASKRLAGSEKESFFSLSYKPWFESKILCLVPKREFKPSPSVDGVWVCVTKRDPPIVLDRRIYLDFLSFCFLNTKDNFKSTLRKLFSHKQIKIISQNIHLPVSISSIDFEAFSYIFEVFSKYNLSDKMILIKGSYNKLLGLQSNINKEHKTRRSS